MKVCSGAEGLADRSRSETDRTALCTILVVPLRSNASLLASFAFPETYTLRIGLQQQRRYACGTALIIQGYIDDIGAVGVNTLAGEQILGLHTQFDLHAGTAYVGQLAVHEQQLADQHRTVKCHTVHRDRHGRSTRVTAGDDSTTFVTKLENDAAVNRTQTVGMLWL